MMTLYYKMELESKNVDKGQTKLSIVVMWGLKNSARYYKLFINCMHIQTKHYIIIIIFKWPVYQIVKNAYF